MAKNKRRAKQCLGCHDSFVTYRNYDYCQDCAINNNRYVQNHFPECGDGSGQVKFPKQKARPCKLCYLTSMKKITPLKSQKASIDPETQF
jgi:hypothetical protein